MTQLILAEFGDSEMLLEAIRRGRDAGFKRIDAHTPFRVDGMEAALGATAGWIRTAMLVAGLAVAAIAFVLQWYSAVIDYPINVGGRPLNSWQAFVIPSFEIGILFAGVGGVLALLYLAGLPRPHSLIFSAKGFERASQDRFFLAVADPGVQTETVAGLLDGLALLSVQMVEE
jgi:Protein of unknown function (DUF3341)